MQSQRIIHVSKLIFQQSPYYLPWLYRSEISQSQQNLLVQSIIKWGIQSPITVYQNANSGSYIVIDGFSRIQAANQLGIKEINSQIQETLDPMRIADHILYDHYDIITSRFINKVRFIDFLVRQSINQESIIHVMFPALQMQPHVDLLGKCLRIAAFPDFVLDFLHDKLISLKQSLKLSYYPIELITSILQLKDSVHLTASMVLELCEHIFDYHRSSGRTIADIFQEEAYIQLLQSPFTAHEKAPMIRSYFRAKRYPILTDINSQMQQISGQLQLPSFVQCEWDSTLENKAVHLNIAIKTDQQFIQALAVLQQPDMHTKITQLLQFL